MGIELSLIEKVRFRELVRDSIRRHQEIIGHWARFCLGHEAIEIFLHDYYGIPYPAEGATTDWLCPRRAFMKEHGFDGYAEFWRKRQDEAALP
jgi:hypothetical protein